MKLFRFVLYIVVMAAVCAQQGMSQISSTAPLSGSVSDSSGAVIPGASINVVNEATRARFETLTIENGVFVIPALTPGTYTVSVSLPGFKTTHVPNVKIDAGNPATVRVTLQVGDVADSVTVEAGGEILQTQTATVTTTIDVKQVMELPVSRTALEFTTLLPGISQTGDSRTSRINGLSRNSVNVTIDGINTQEYLKDTDYFSYITPRADAIEEVTVSSAAAGAESSAQGGVQVKMVTRQGSNEFHGSVYEYLQNTSLNANGWFTNRDIPADPKTGKAPRNRSILNQYGFRLGGPIMLPGVLDGHNRAFFFFNYEEVRQPSSVVRNRTIMSPDAQRGVFQYNAAGGVQRVDLLALAANNRQVSTVDPTMTKLLSDIRSSTSGTGGILPLTDPNQERFTFQNQVSSNRRFPTTRLDFNLTQKHHLEASYWYNRYNTYPDTLNNADQTFPGFPQIAGQSSDRFSYSLALRSTLSPRLVNEARFGFTGGTVRFYPERSLKDFAGSVGNLAGFQLNLTSTSALANASLGYSNAAAGTTVSRRNAPITFFGDTLNWQKGSHALSFGGSMTESKVFLYQRTIVPTITFGIDSSDPSNSMFTTANFQGAATADLNRAKALYATLTGRVVQISSSATIDEQTGEYVYLGHDRERSRQREFGFFAQDSWRKSSNLTLNYGLRWELQFPYRALNNRYTTTTMDSLYGISGPGNLFKPGVLTGKQTEFFPLKPGAAPYETEWANFAPSFGFAWSPKFEKKWMKRVLGESAVLRAGYSIAFVRRSNALFDDGFDDNPGGVITLTRNMNNGNLVSGPATNALPVLLREPPRLGPPNFAKTPSYPIYGANSQSAVIFHPNFKVPYVESWTIGLQRELDKNTALEIRYVGNRSLQNGENWNLNEANIVENGFKEEFKLAMANLQANIAANRGNTFRYAGPGTGTSPLPATFAYLVGRGNPSDASLYSTASTSPFANTTLVNRLAVNSPIPYMFASDLYTDATRRANAEAAGLPRNLFLVNPDLTDVIYMGNGGYTNYNSVVFEVRRRLVKGLQLNSSYVFSRTFATYRYSLRQPRANAVSISASTTRNGFTTAGDIPHVFKANWVYELPIGRSKWLFGGVNGVMDRLISGWQLHGTARVQSGDPLDVGNVRLAGMTRKDLQKALQIRLDDANRIVYFLPQDIIDNTIRAFSVSATTANGYGSLGAPTGRYIAPANNSGCIETYAGDCGGSAHVIYGPRFTLVDLSLAKKTKIRENVEFEIRAEMFNAFNLQNFNGAFPNNPPTTANLSSPTLGQATSADAARVVQIVGRINF